MIEPIKFSCSHVVDTRRLYESHFYCCETGRPVLNSYYDIVGTWEVGEWPDTEDQTHSFTFSESAWELMEICAAVSCEKNIDMPEIGKLAEWIYNWTYNLRGEPFTKHEGILLNQPRWLMEEMLAIAESRRDEEFLIKPREKKQNGL